MTNRTKLLQDLEELLENAEINEWVDGASLQDPRGLAQEILNLVEASAPKAKAPSDRQRAKLERNLQIAEDNLADAEHRLSTWGFGMSPSQIRKLEEFIAGCEKTRDTLKARLDAS